MPTFTEAEIKRLNELRRLDCATDERLKAASIKFDDFRLLLRRVAELDLDEYHSADELVNFMLRRLEEDLRASQAHLEEMVEMTRIAELLVKESTRALAATKALAAGELYADGAEVGIRWDELETEFRMGGFFPPQADPEAEAVAEPAPVEPAPPPEEAPLLPPIPPEPAPLPPAQLSKAAKRAIAAPMSAEQQEDAIYAALKVSAGDEPQVQVSTKVLAEASGVPQGSALHVLWRLEKAGRIEIIPTERVGGAPLPNTYRFIDPAAAEEPPKALGVAAYLADNPDLPAAYEAAAEPVVAERAAEQLAGAWGARVKAPKPSGIVPQSIALRDRILGTLSKAACTTSGLASMLDVKELSISQTLSAMEHEGTVKADEMPDAGRRAQLWRRAPEAADAA